MVPSGTAYVEVCHADITVADGCTRPLMPMLRLRTTSDGPSDRWRPTVLPVREVAGLVDLDGIVWDEYDPISWARMTTALRRLAMRDLLDRIEPVPADDCARSCTPAAVTVDAEDLPPPPDLAPQVAAALLIAAPAAPPRLLAHISTVEASTS